MPTEQLSRVSTCTESLTRGTCSLVKLPLEGTRKPRAPRALQAVSWGMALDTYTCTAYSREVVYARV